MNGNIGNNTPPVTAGSALEGIRRVAQSNVFYIALILLAVQTVFNLVLSCVYFNGIVNLIVSILETAAGTVSVIGLYNFSRSCGGNNPSVKGLVAVIASEIFMTALNAVVVGISNVKTALAIAETSIADFYRSIVGENLTLDESALELIENNKGIFVAMIVIASMTAILAYCGICVLTVFSVRKGIRTTKTGVYAGKINGFYTAFLIFTVVMNVFSVFAGMSQSGGYADGMMLTLSTMQILIGAAVQAMFIACIFSYNRIGANEWTGK